MAWNSCCVLGKNVYSGVNAGMPQVIGVLPPTPLGSTPTMSKRARRVSEEKGSAAGAQGVGVDGVGADEVCDRTVSRPARVEEEGADAVSGVVGGAASDGHVDLPTLRMRPVSGHPQRAALGHRRARTLSEVDAVPRCAEGLLGRPRGRRGNQSGAEGADNQPSKSASNVHRELPTKRSNLSRDPKLTSLCASGRSQPIAKVPPLNSPRHARGCQQKGNRCVAAPNTEWSRWNSDRGKPTASGHGEYLQAPSFAHSSLSGPACRSGQSGIADEGHHETYPSRTGVSCSGRRAPKQM